MIEEHLKAILKELGLSHLEETPKRIAKMYREEIFTGLIPDNFPSLTLLDAPSNQPITIENIQFVSFCEHHFLPMFGKAHIHYTPNKKILGFGNFHDIVHHFAKRPQLQERLTEEIGHCLDKILEPYELTIEIEAEHSCVRARGALAQETLFRTHFASSRRSSRIT